MAWRRQPSGHVLTWPFLSARQRETGNCGSVLPTATAAAKSLQSCLTLCDPIDGSPPGPRPWNSPGKNTGMDCHFLLQCMKVKSESEVTQLCPTLSDLMDCSLPGSSVHGIFLARALDWGAIAFYIMSTRAVKFKKTYYCIKCWCWQG